VGTTALDGGLCAAGITTELRALARDQPVLNYNDKQTFSPLALLTTPLLALVAPAADLDRQVTARLDNQIAVFIAAWERGKGQ
jgi:hypothetical protein